MAGRGGNDDTSSPDQRPSASSEGPRTYGANKVSSYSKGSRLNTSPGTTGLGVQTSDRTMRACDPCRQRKIKCDGGHPCRHCKISFYDCAYSEPTRKRRKRVRTSEQFAALETRLKEMESYMKVVGVSAALESNRGHLSPLSGSPVQDESAGKPLSSDPAEYATTRHAIEQGEAGYQGYSADRAFIQRMKEKLGNWPGIEVNRRLLPRDRAAPKLFGQQDQSEYNDCLPPKQRAIALVDAALDSHVLLCIIHRPSFDSSLNLLYSLSRSEYSTEEVRFLPLLYAVMALGCLWHESEVDTPTREHVAEEATQYFAASRCLVDIADCKDIFSLQAIFFLNLFLSCTARVGTCYSYVGHALSLALRMGLHRSIFKEDDLIAREVGKRVFWATRLLSNYFAAVCGLPRLLSDEDIDQDMPVEVNDEYIEKLRITPQPPGEICHTARLNAFITLHNILQEVIRHIYPTCGTKIAPGRALMSYRINVDKVRHIENNLKRWANSLPAGYRLGTDKASGAQLRAQYLLCMGHSHVQLYLYRPFLHYLTKARDASPPAPEQKFSLYATACIKASHNIIRLSEDMCKRGLLAGGNWTVMHMIFGSILALIYVLLDSTEWEGAEGIFEDLAIGRQVLAFQSRSSIAAERGRTILTVMIALLPNELKGTRERLQMLDTDGSELKPNDSDIQAPPPAEVFFNTASLAASAFDLNSVPASSSKPTDIIRHNPRPGNPTDTTGKAEQAPNFLKQSSFQNFNTSATVPHAADTISPTVTTESYQTYAYQNPATSLSQPQMFPSFTDYQVPVNTPWPTATVPLSSPTYEYIEAQPFNFPPNRMGDGWGNTIPTAMDTALNQDITDEQMAELFSAGDAELGLGGLFNFEDLF